MRKLIKMFVRLVVVVVVGLCLVGCLEGAGDGGFVCGRLGGGLGVVVSVIMCVIILHYKKCMLSVHTICTYYLYILSVHTTSKSLQQYNTIRYKITQHDSL